MAEFLDKKDDELINIIVDDFTKAEKAKQPYYTQWQDSYRLYKSILKYTNEGRSNCFIPYTWTIVEQLVSKSLQALFTKKPYVGFAPQSQNDVEASEQMESLVYFQMKDKMNLPIKSVDVFRSALIYGVQLVQTEWRHDQKKIKKRQPIKEMGATVGEQVVEQMVDIYNDPDMDVLPIENIFPDPEGYDVQSCRFIITRTFKDTKYLKEMENKGIWTLPDIMTEGTYTFSDNSLDGFRNDINGVDSIPYADRKKTHEIISWYTDDYVIEVLDRQHILRKIENPYWNGEKPFIRAVGFTDERSFWGESLVRVMSSLQEQLNVIRNQRIDNVSLVLNKVFLRNASDDILDDQLEDDGSLNIFGGKVLDVRDTERSLRVLDIPDVTGSSYQEESIIKQDMQYVSAVSEQSRGMQAKSRTTATELNIMSQNAEQVFNYFISMIEFSYLIPLGDTIKKLNQQFITTEKTSRIFEDDTAQYSFKTYTPETINGDFDIVSVNPRYEAESTKEARRQQLLDMFNTFISNQVTQPYLNIPKILEEIMSSYEIKDYKTLIQPQVLQQVDYENAQLAQGVPPEQIQTNDPSQMQGQQPMSPNQQQAMQGVDTRGLSPQDVQTAMSMAGMGGQPQQGQPPMQQPQIDPSQMVQQQPMSSQDEVDAQKQQLIKMIAELPPEEQAKVLAELDKTGGQ